MHSFQNKIAVVTGAGSGMGRYMAIQLAQQSATVLMTDINESSLLETKQMLEADKGICKAYVVDAGDKSQIEAFAEKVLAEFKYIDVLINNAGISIGLATLNEIPLGDFERLMSINLWGVIHHTRVFLPTLLTRPEAAIVNVSSVFGLTGIPGQIPYCTAKFAVRGFTESLRLELSGTHVAVTCVHPGGIKTGIVTNGIHYKDKEAAAMKFDKNALTSAPKAAQIIIRAIKKKSKRVMVGPDAQLIRFFTQLAPGMVDRLALNMKKDFE
jgi:NADP-dependent 3-hydroxy acid dehydrogenase YdfG